MSRSSPPERRLSRRVADVGKTGSGAQAGGQAAPPPRQTQTPSPPKKAVRPYEQPAPGNPGAAEAWELEHQMAVKQEAKVRMLLENLKK